MRKIIFIVTLAAIFGLAGFGCVRTPEPAVKDQDQPAAAESAVAVWGEGKLLTVGASIVYGDGLTVRLEAINDSRCPAGVQCIWQGELAPILRLRGGMLTTEMEVVLGTVRGLTGAAGDYAVSASDVSAESVVLVVAKSADQLAAHQDKIRVASPQPDAAVASPLVVLGEARGSWYFEASFPVKLFDANGKLLAAVPAQAQGDWMTGEFVPFAVSLVFEPPATATGTLVLVKDNPSGLPENADEVRLPVHFAVEVGETRAVKLYRYDPSRDRDAAGNIQCSRAGLVAVERRIPVTKTPIQDTIRLLLKGGLTDAERAAGITTEFPLAGVELRSANLKSGVLTLEFVDPNNRTGGGSCRVGILWAQIESTAKQFPEVKTARFIPAELFQP
ncbi:MAG: Gmad2 immunoglobulin-like domain-containing protein [Patescibacteria group bacterium]|jgi:hypothetical protein